MSKPKILHVDDSIVSSNVVAPALTHVVGTDGNDTITLGNGGFFVDAGAGNDTITTGSGNDVINGGAGADIIKAGAGDDTVDGGAGNDRIDGGAGNNILNGGDGNDHIFSTPATRSAPTSTQAMAPTRSTLAITFTAAAPTPPLSMAT